MKKGVSFLPILGIVLLFGCQGTKVQQAVEGLKTDVQNLVTDLEGAKPILGTVSDLEAKVAGKLSKAQIDALIGEVASAKTSIAGILPLEEKVAVLKDSLVALNEKAKGKVKEDVTTLIGKVDNISMGIGEFRSADMRLDGLRTKLEGMKVKPVPAKPKPKKSIPAPKRK